MNLLDFSRQYPDEASCEAAFRSFRERHGLFCSQCGGLRLIWNPSPKSWTYMDCEHEMQLRSGTVMQGSHLPVRDWFAAMFLLTATKRAISTKEIQRQLVRKRYQPVWEMVYKLRDVTGQRDSLYALHGDMEVDEGFFSTETPEEQNDCPLKRGRGSQRKTSVLVMAGSGLPDTPPLKKYSTTKTVGHINMQVISDFKAATIMGKIKAGTDGNAGVATDGFSSYAALEKDGVAISHHAFVTDDKRSVGKVLPWVHIAIGNAKRSILDTYHDIKAEFLNSTSTSSAISSTEGISVSVSLTGSNFAHVRIGRSLNIGFIDWEHADIHFLLFLGVAEKRIKEWRKNNQRGTSFI